MLKAYMRHTLINEESDKVTENKFSYSDTTTYTPNLLLQSSTEDFVEAKSLFLVN